MRRDQTRYHGVWDAGYEAGMEEANRILARAVDAEVAFAPPGNRWDQNLIAIRMGGRIYDAARQTVIQMLAHALARKP